MTARVTEKDFILNTVTLRFWLPVATIFHSSLNVISSLKDRQENSRGRRHNVLEKEQDWRAKGKIFPAQRGIASMPLVKSSQQEQRKY